MSWLGKAAALAAALAMSSALMAASPLPAEAKVKASPAARAAPKAVAPAKQGAKASAKPIAVGRTAGFAASCRAASSMPKIARPSPTPRSGMFSASPTPCPYPWWIAFDDGGRDDDEKEEKPEWMKENETWGNV